MLTRTSEYVLRAMIYLAQHAEERPIPGRRIAEDARIPAKYLSNILGSLVRQGFLDSCPGKTGGFELRRPPEAIVLFDLIAPYEQFDSSHCPFGNERCSDEDPCLAHSHWKKVVDAERRFLKGTSILDVSRPRSKRMKGGRAGGEPRSKARSRTKRR